MIFWMTFFTAFCFVIVACGFLVFDWLQQTTREAEAYRYRVWRERGRP